MKLRKGPPTEDEITKVISKFEEIVCSKCDIKDRCDKFPLQKFVCSYKLLKKRSKDVDNI